jgi:hypothetical protein
VPLQLRDLLVKETNGVWRCSLAPLCRQLQSRQLLRDELQLLLRKIAVNDHRKLGKRKRRPSNHQYEHQCAPLRSLLFDNAISIRLAEPKCNRRRERHPFCRIVLLWNQTRQRQPIGAGEREIIEPAQQNLGFQQPFGAMVCVSKLRA